MDEKDNGWIKKLRNRMNDYPEPVPEELWNRLEEELGIPRKVIPLWRRISAVAAVVLLAISVSVIWWLRQSEVREQTVAEMVPEGQVNTEEVPDMVVPEQFMTQETFDIRHTQISRSELWEDVPDEHLIQTENDETEDRSDKADLDKSENDAGQNRNKQSQPFYSSRVNKENNYSRYAVMGKKRNRNWSVGFSAGNGTFASSDRMDGYVSLPRTIRAMGALSTSVGLTDIDKLVQFANLAEGTSGESDVKYRMPLTFEVSVRWALAKKWAVETGVFYTRLSSETTSGGEQNNYGWEDKLHYVGVPLKASRILWDNKRFEVYATAGGAVEKCVSGKRTMVYNVAKSSSGSDETDIKVKPLQWSVSISAGAQCKLTDNVGIYAEPGAVYYFDDGSSVNTVWKEHPFNLNLQFGIRLTLPK